MATPRFHGGGAWTTIVTSSAPIGADGWVHFVGTYKFGDDPLLYVNGVRQPDSGVAAVIGTDNGNIPGTILEIGAGNDTARTPSGSIDDTRLYRRVLGGGRNKKSL